MRDPIIEFTDHCLTVTIVVMGSLLLLALCADLGRSHDHRCRTDPGAQECQVETSGLAP